MIVLKSPLVRLFVKNFEDTSSPAVRTACGKLSGTVGIVCNLLLALGKLTVGLISRSISVSADALNNLSDAASSVITLIGFRIAEKPADRDHPFGHARMEYLASMFISLLILVIGFELAKSSVEKMLRPAPTEFSWVTVGVLLASVCVKLWMMRFNRRLGNEISSPALLATAVDSRNDVLATSAVLASLLVGRFAGFDPDAYVGFAVALFILYSGFDLARSSIDPLLGSAPDPELSKAIAEKILSYEDVLGVHDLIVHDYGPGRRFASAHVEMDRNLDVLTAHNIIDGIERDFDSELQLQLVIHYDPIVTDDAVLTEKRQAVSELVRALDPRLSIHDFRMVEGPRHTNVIFDLVIPFDLEQDRESLKEQISQQIRNRWKDHYAVICVDSSAFNE